MISSPRLISLYSSPYSCTTTVNLYLPYRWLPLPVIRQLRLHNGLSEDSYQLVNLVPPYMVKNLVYRLSGLAVSLHIHQVLDRTYSKVQPPS